MIDLKNNYRKEYKGTKVFIIITVIFVLYIVGVINANNKAKPFKEALTLIDEAEGPVKKQMIEASNLDQKLFIENEKKYTSLFVKASKINLVDYPILKGFIDEKNKLNNEILVFDEKIMSGKLKLTKEEGEKIIEQFIIRNNNIYDRYATYGRKETWMKLFFVRL